MTEEVPNFSNVPDGAVKELHRQAELCLMGTVQLATSVDQRATTTSGILGGGAVALLAASAAMGSASHPIFPFIAAAIATAAVLYLGALLCASAARSVDFFVAGYEPRLLAPAASDENSILRYAAEDLQIRINRNRLSLARSSRLFTWGQRIGLLAGPIGAITFVLWTLLVISQYLS